MADSKQTKHKHPPTRRMVAIRDTRIDLGGGKTFAVKKGNIIKISKPYDGQAGRSVLVEPHGSVDGGHKGPSLFVANPADLAGIFKPMAADSTETTRAYRAERGAKHARLGGEKTGRRSFTNEDNDTKVTQKEETEMEPEKTETEIDNTVSDVENTNTTQYLVENAGYDYGEFLEFLEALVNLEDESEYETVIESLEDDLRQLTIGVLDNLLAEANKTNKAPYNPAKEGAKTLGGSIRFLARQSKVGTPEDAETEKYVRSMADKYPEKVAALNAAHLGGKDKNSTANDDKVDANIAKRGKGLVDVSTGKADRTGERSNKDKNRHHELQSKLGLPVGSHRPATSLRYDGNLAHRQKLGTHVDKSSGDKVVTSPTPYPNQGRSTVLGDLDRNNVTKNDPSALRRAADALYKAGRASEAEKVGSQASSMAKHNKAEQDKRKSEKAAMAAVKEETDMEITESLTSLAGKQDAVNFADVVQRKLDLLAHEAIENLKASAGGSFSSDTEQVEEQIDSEENEEEEIETENEEEIVENSSGSHTAYMTKSGKEALETARKHGYDSEPARKAFKKEQDEGAFRLRDHRFETIKNARARVDELKNKIEAATDREERARLVDRLGKIKKYLASRGG